MADIFDQFANLTLNNEEARSDADLIKVNPYLTPEVKAIHGVQTGVIIDKYIPILGQFEDIGLVDPGTCGVNAFTDPIPVSQKTWTPKLISARIAICKDDLNVKFKAWMESQIASKRWEDINNDLKQYVLDKTQEAVTRGIIRVAEFGDTAAALATSGGHFSAGTTVALFSMLDGMWKQIFTDNALGAAALIKRYTIAENTEATKANQLALASDTAKNAFEYMITNIAPEAKSGNLVIQCTQTLWDNWRQYVIGKGGEFNTQLLTKGMSEKEYGGYPIIVRNDWDRIIRKYYDDGTAYWLPHRATLNDINNVPVGTSDTESFSALDAFYWKKDKQYYIDVAWREDCKILQEINMATAY
jgi:hypothetical protein